MLYTIKYCALCCSEPNYADLKSVVELGIPRFVHTWISSSPEQTIDFMVCPLPLFERKVPLAFMIEPLRTLPESSKHDKYAGSFTSPIASHLSLVADLRAKSSASRHGRYLRLDALLHNSSSSFPNHFGSVIYFQQRLESLCYLTQAAERYRTLRSFFCSTIPQSSERF